MGSWDGGGSEENDPFGGGEPIGELGKDIWDRSSRMD